MTTLTSKRLATFAAAGVGAAATLAGLATTTAVPAAHAASCTVPGPELDFVMRPYGYTVNVLAKGSNLDGAAMSTGIGEPRWAGGTASGSIAGNAVDFIITWNPQSGGGTTHFRGTVGDDGFARGTATGAAAHNDVGETVFQPTAWDSINPLNCPAAQAQNPPAATQPVVTVNDDVDVYNVKNEPDGTGHIVGILRAKSQVQLVGSCQPKSWCQVSGSPVPGGTGWVWGALQLP